MKEDQKLKSLFYKVLKDLELIINKSETNLMMRHAEKSHFLQKERECLVLLNYLMENKEFMLKELQKWF